MRLTLPRPPTVNVPTYSVTFSSGQEVPRPSQMRSSPPRSLGPRFYLEARRFRQRRGQLVRDSDEHRAVCAPELVAVAHTQPPEEPEHVLDEQRPLAELGECPVERGEREIGRSGAHHSRAQPSPLHTPSPGHGGRARSSTSTDVFYWTGLRYMREQEYEHYITSKAITSKGESAQSTCIQVTCGYLSALSDNNHVRSQW